MASLPSSISPRERHYGLNQQWYETHPPPDHNPSRTTFLRGLAGSPSTSTESLNNIFTKYCVAHHLWDFPSPVFSDAGFPAYYATTADISQAICEKYPGAPQRWVERWVRALVMASYDHPREPFFAEPRDDPGKESKLLCECNKPTIPLHQMTFVLTTLPTPTTGASILELVASRCLRRERFSDVPSEYRLSMFQMEFQSVLRDKVTGTDLDMGRGRIQWIRNGVLEMIEDQNDFEIAVAQLYHERNNSWELFFLFDPDREEEEELKEERREKGEEEEGEEEEGEEEEGEEEEEEEEGEEEEEEEDGGAVTDNNKMEFINPTTYVDGLGDIGKLKGKASDHRQPVITQPKAMLDKEKGREEEKPNIHDELVHAEAEWLASKGRIKEKYSDNASLRYIQDNSTSKGEDKGKEKMPGDDILISKEKGNGRASDTEDISNSQCDRSIRKGKGREKDVDYDTSTGVQLKEIATSRSKGKKKPSDIERTTPGQSEVSTPKEKSSNLGESDSGTTKQSNSGTPQGVEHFEICKNSENITIDEMGRQVIYVVTKANDWAKDAEDARKKAEDRIKEAKQKERETGLQAQTEAQKQRDTRYAARMPSQTTATVSPAPKQRPLMASNSQVTHKETIARSNKFGPTRPKLSSSKISSTPSSNTDTVTQGRQNHISLRSASSESLPYVMTDKERREKAMRVRRQFPALEMPGLKDTEYALIETKGSVHEAFISLGGTPNKSKVLMTPRRTPLKLTGSVNPSGPSRSVEKGERININAEKREACSPMYGKKHQEGSPENRPLPEVSLLTPPSSSAKDKRTKLNLPKRLQNAAQSAGRHISFSSSNGQKNDACQSSSSPSTFRSTNLRSMFEALKSRGEQPRLSSEIESGYYEFFVTKERAYKAGGDKDDAINPLDGYRKTDEELESDEDTEETKKPVKQPKDAMGLLKGLQNLKGLAQLTEMGGDDSDMKRWLDCCRFFQIDPSETGMKERVRIVGIKQPLFQYQAFSVYWQIINSRKFGGGFVADMPGLGKTLVFLSLLIVERQLCLLWGEVNDSRRTKDGKHLPIAGQVATDVCPSQKERPGWIACPCAFSNPTSQIPPQPGVRIVIVPASLLSNWRAEWSKNIDIARKDLDMSILLAHEGSVAGHGDMAQMADLPANITMLRANKVQKAPDSAKANQERFLVLTTAQSYDAWVERFKYGGTRSHVMVLEPSLLKNKYIWTTGYKYNIQFGIACVDESHEEYNIEKGGAGVLARLPGNPICWGYSGTPLDKSPRCLEGVLWALEQQAKKIDIESLASGWTQNNEMRNFRREVFDKICKEFESCNKLGSPSPSTLDSLKKQLLPFLTTFMIRRTPEHRWFGHPLVALNKHLHRDVFLLHNNKYDEKIKALIPEIEADAADRLQKIQTIWDNAPEAQRSIERPRALGVNNTIHTQYKLRILATCPALIMLTTGANAMTLKTDELKKWRGSNEKNSPYAKNLSEIFENSPKLMWLRECILDLEKHLGVDGLEQKMVIVTNFNCIALIVKLMIEHYLPCKKGRVGLVYAEMSTTARTVMLEAFTDAMTENKQGTAVRKRKENIQLLIGTTPILSKGLQLTRACNIVLMEPDQEFYRELQGYARVNRIGQKNPWTFSYRLIDDGSAVEDSILQRQKERGEFPGRVLKPGDVERMGPRDDWASIEDESDVLERLVSWAAPKKMSTRLEPTLRRVDRLPDLRGSMAGLERIVKGARS